MSNKLSIGSPTERINVGEAKRGLFSYKSSRYTTRKAEQFVSVVLEITAGTNHITVYL